MYNFNENYWNTHCLKGEYNEKCGAKASGQMQWEADSRSSGSQSLCRFARILSWFGSLCPTAPILRDVCQCRSRITVKKQLI